MVEERATSNRGNALLNRLGGPPGPYAAVCVVMAVAWFPFRLLLDRGDPVAESIAASGLQGALWALMWLALGWGQRIHRKASGATDDVPPLGAAARLARARRGAVVGLGVGVPFFGGLVVLSVSTGREWAYAISFAVVLAVIFAVAARSLRSASSGQDGQGDGARVSPP
ncbi:hypothetical protein [Actinoplanes sp. DH11]|uniref:hypothetical protein n=1 Tax=Actinoplanes sp. DH11 TaxID=2857011 RepID=UPI001E305E34|nr:hypothetical protein [Actinoplanes sp. DH11]